MSKKGCAKRVFAFVFFGSGLAALGGYLWMQDGLKPTSESKKRFLRFDESTGMVQVMEVLEREGFVKNALAYRVAARIWKRPVTVASGTYAFQGGMTSDEIYRSLQSPVKQMFRFPETNWARRSANLLERAQICTADQYMAEWAEPTKYQKGFALPLPKTGSLEGFLFPDTYELPPLLGANAVIERQLSTFEKRVKPLVKDKSKLYRALIIASMVELEVAKDSERPIVAGIIENRLKKGIPLQIDATLNYGIQKWRPLTYGDLKKDGPYNTYTRKGLPPTPICSPSLKSIKAALNPAKHEFLYYVAMPEKYHLFSRTFDEHRKNIARRKAALKALQK